jgi:hypothetical protein
MTVSIDGKEFTVEYSFSDSRALIRFEGALVFADRASDGVWELSGEPARDGEEKRVYHDIISPELDKTVVTVTPPQNPETD